MPGLLQQTLGKQAVKATQDKLKQGGVSTGLKNKPSHFDKIMSNKALKAGNITELEALAKMGSLRGHKTVGTLTSQDLDFRAGSGANTVSDQDSRTSTSMGKILKGLSDLNEGQLRMDRILDMSLMGRKFAPNELLVLQAQVYRVATEMELAGKLVEKGVGGIQATFRTQLG